VNRWWRTWQEEGADGIGNTQRTGFGGLPIRTGVTDFTPAMGRKQRFSWPAEPTDVVHARSRKLLVRDQSPPAQRIPDFTRAWTGLLTRRA
jgi:hypothetical protein